MAKAHWKGTLVPEVGDDLLGSWDTFSDSLGIITPVGSIAAARAVLSKAADEGHPPTSTHPAYFDVDGNLYRSAGLRTGGGVWVLQALSEVEAWDGTYNNSWTNRLGAGVFTGMIKADIPVRDYDRRVVVDGVLYGSVSSGNIDACVQAQGRMKLARLDTGDAQSTSVTVQAIIKAGEAPNIALGLRGGSPSGGTATLSHDPSLNYLGVTAYPITMA